MLPWHPLELSNNSAGINRAQWSLSLTIQAETLHNESEFLFPLSFVNMEALAVIIFVQ